MGDDEEEVVAATYDKLPKWRGHAAATELKPRPMSWNTWVAHVNMTIERDAAKLIFKKQTVDAAPIYTKMAERVDPDLYRVVSTRLEEQGEKKTNFMEIAKLDADAKERYYENLYQKTMELMMDQPALERLIKSAWDTLKRPRGTQRRRFTALMFECLMTSWP
eukprot:scaffold26836_cov43-Prasinocladus_malaysianus.AAC.1